MVDAIRAHPKFEEIKFKLAADPAQAQAVSTRTRCFHLHTFVPSGGSRGCPTRT
jgi:hypothetical protein